MRTRSSSPTRLQPAKQRGNDMAKQAGGAQIADVETEVVDSESASGGDVAGDTEARTAYREASQAGLLDKQPEEAEEVVGEAASADAKASSAAPTVKADIQPKADTVTRDQQDQQREQELQQ